MFDQMHKTSHEEDWQREITHVLFARRRLMLTTAAAIVAGSVLVALFWPKTYEASSSLLLLGKRAQASPSALDIIELRNPEVSSQDIISELEIIRSPELARRVALQLRKDAGWAESDLNEELEKAAGKFLSRLEAIGVVDSCAIRLTFKGRSAVAAEQGLETLLKVYTQYRAEVFSPPGQSEYFEKRIVYYQNQLDELVEGIQSQEGEVNPVFIDQVIAGDLRRLGALQQQLADLEMERATSTYVDNASLQTRIEMVQRAIKQLQKETNETQAKRLTADSVFRQVELIRRSLDIFAKRAEEARINDSIAREHLTGDISVLNRATGTASLLFPRKGLTLLLGMIVAMITGLSAGLLAEFLDHSIRRPEDVQNYTGLPVLCSFSVLNADEPAPREKFADRTKKTSRRGASET